MRISTFFHTHASGWSVPRLPSELDSTRTLVLCFGAPSYAERPAALAAMRDAFPTSVIAGCSTAGEIVGPRLRDESLSVAVIAFESVRITAETTTVDSMSMSASTGRRLGRRLATRSDVTAAFVLSDGLSVNGTALLSGLSGALPAGTTISGGLAADGPRFGRTWVLADGLPRTGVVCAVGLSGERLRPGYGSMGGWDIFGPERLVTRSTDNILFELDGRPALDLYHEYLGDLAADLPASGLRFPLAVRPPHGNAAPLVRTILGVDERARSLTFAGDVPQGHLAQLMRATADRLVDGAGGAASAARAVRDDEPVISIAISCVGRRLVLGERTEDEIEAAFAELPAGSHQIGFYSYGEICPSGALTCDLQNQTMTLTTLSEAAA